MTVSVEDIDRWDAGDVREVFNAARSRAEAAFEAADGIAELPAFGTWGGEAAEAAKESIGQTRKDLDAHGQEALAVAKAAGKAADDIESVKSKLAQLRFNAADAGFGIDPIGNQVLPGPELEANMVEMLAAEPTRQELQARLAALLAEAAGVDQELARAIGMATGTTPIPEGPHTNDPVLQDILSRPIPEDPNQFHDMWEPLKPEQKNFLYEQDPFIGNHPGMPFADKDHYNRRHLKELIRDNKADIDRMQPRFDELARRVYMGDTSSATGEELARLGPQLAAARHDEKVYETVRKAVEVDPKDKNAFRPDVPRLLSYLDDQGKAAVSLGNPDTATRNAILVPGTGQDLLALQGSFDKSAAMYDAALQADRSLEGKLAVTTWMGYDRPMNLAEAAFPGRAETGGASLDQFLDGMHASHVGPSAIDTVVGHSYGSSVVGGAATGGNDLAADNVIAVGSPGMLVDHAGELNLGEGAQVYSMTARNDIISLATDATLGADPYGAAYGATRLWADPGPSWDPTGIIGDVKAHSSYWDPGKPGLANMGAIIAGRPPVQIVTPEGRVTP